MMHLFAITCCAAFLASCNAQSLQQKPLFGDIPPTTIPSGEIGLSESPTPLEFHLRQIYHHGGYKYPNLLRRADVGNVVSATSDNFGRYRARSRAIEMGRPTTVNDYNNGIHLQQIDTQERWSIQRVSSPDVTDRETVLSFARMSLDAYTEEPNTGEWRDVGSGFNYTEDFGWEKDGIRGHVFADTTNQTVVIAMKGTSLPFVDPWGSITNDKTNDNLLFSCCCAQGPNFRWSVWSKPCHCETESNVCNSTCLVQAIKDKTQYYYAAHKLYHNISQAYPNADIWLTGHSLGGSLASLVALTVGQPAVAFEAPPEKMAAIRLGLISSSTSVIDPRSVGIYHFGHTADDIFMGNCNAFNSICSWGGYAMETKCHAGHVCVYDTIKDLNWTANARHNHGIQVVLDDVLEAYNELPDCTVAKNCTDCGDWSFEKKPAN